MREVIPDAWLHPQAGKMGSPFKTPPVHPSHARTGSQNQLISRRPRDTSLPT